MMTTEEFRKQLRNFLLETTDISEGELDIAIAITVGLTRTPESFRKRLGDLLLATTSNILAEVENK